MRNIKKNTVNLGYFNIRIYGRGLIRGYTVALILFLLVAVLITYSSVGEHIIPLSTSIIMIIGIVFSAMYCSVKLRSKGWLHGGIVGLIFVLILIIISKAFISGYSFDQITLYKMILGLGAGAIGGMLGVNIK
ncbi:TIGR04086 family membrane protein [Alkaliphilus oremlandii]|uniref:TIGR04086 family membrane protein n=1 Tax=Alkaliphilus oremlandii (strain OhILAs) TaxID=350688 RepID=A8MGN7_ALKOO|nr:TIGR04086 family membrane protein [Alkaliphilus oremlandii]ABW19260.1 hypothetical protein Clos_1720 [Alkaliphilus oremlandii OhILAs]